MHESDDPPRRTIPLPASPLLETLTDYLAEAIMIVRADGKVTSRLAPPDGLLGYGDGTGEHVFDHVHPDDLPALSVMGSAILGSRPGWHGTGEARLGHADGTWRRYEVYVVNRTDDPAVDGLVVRVRELVEPPQETLATGLESVANEVMIESLTEALPVPVLALGRFGHVLFANAAARDLTGRDTLALRHDGLPGLADGDDREELADALRDLRRGPGLRLVTIAMRGRRGGDDPRRIEVRLESKGLPGLTSWIVTTLEDVTERYLAESELRRRASEDRLTGLPNRAAVLDLLRERLRAAPEDVAVVYVDLDRFKVVNDTQGHGAGDDVLVAVAALLRDAVRAGDVVGRLGGDEFAVISRARGVETPEVLGRRIATEFSARCERGDLPVVASVGTAQGRAGDAPRDLLHRADRAMYVHKRRSDGPTPG